ncbi:MAG: alpha/beta hydrolase [Clostridia bacterium]|nr:alpha/beta hydrolase [Clostridia bacterium]
MALSAKFVRKQLTLFKHIVNNLSLETIRRGQDKIGELMHDAHRDKIVVHEHNFENFEACWISPKDERRHGVVMYLHGGGYCCGMLDYAKGFSSQFAVKMGVRVFCPAYRLAPEHPFPAAIDDALEAYHYLLEKGYAPSEIALCGESAGGGLCYALCLKLRELGEELPATIITASPWVDLTLSGASYEENRTRDPSLSKKLLSYYAKCYTDTPSEPLASPLFADLTGMPTSLNFVGGDEIMLDDARHLHERLLAVGAKSTLVIAPLMWHAYPMYDLKENEEVYRTINLFLNKNFAPEKKLRWVGLDNAAKIYPAARTRSWINVFRLSATLKEAVDVDVLQSALDVTVRRFPTISARLRRGMFWYYLEQLPKAPDVRVENSFPLSPMTYSELRTCAFRTIVHKNRIAVEFFHSLTDGTGGMVFLKTLLAEYVTQKYGEHVPRECGILGRLEEPSADEMEDSFLRYAGDVAASRQENTAFHLKGQKEPDGYLHLTCFSLPVKDVLEKAHDYGATMTEFLTAVMMRALIRVQEIRVPLIHRRRPIKVLVPVNLRTIFPSTTLRNFALYSTPEVDPKLGEYTFEELIRAVHHRLGLEVNAKVMGSRLTTNVNSEKSVILQMTPLFIKNMAMKLVFRLFGECKSCLTVSNLGQVKLPEEVSRHIDRFDFVIGPQSQAPSNCGVLSFGDTLYINFIRNVVECDLEREFHFALMEHGLCATVESNNP